MKHTSVSTPSKRAYSLIELMVVLAIITVLSLIGLPNLFSQDDRYILNNTTEKVRQILADAQIRSLAPTKNDSQGTQVYQVDFSSFKYDAGADDIVSDTAYTSANGYGTRNVTVSRGLAECSDGETRMGSSETVMRNYKMPKSVYVESFYPDIMTQSATTSSVRFYVGRIGYKCGAGDNVSVDSADYYSDSRWKSSSSDGTVTYAKYMVITIASTKISEKRYIVIDRLSSQITVTKEDPQAYISPIEDRLAPKWRDLSAVGEQMYVNVQCLSDNSGAQINVNFARANDWVGSDYADPASFEDKTRLVFYDIFINTDSANSFPESSNKIVVLKYFYPLIPDNNYVNFSFMTDAISISSQPEAFRVVIKTFDEAGNYNTEWTAGSTDPSGDPDGTNPNTGDVGGPGDGTPTDPGDGDGGPTLPGDGGDAGLPAAFKGVWNFVASKLSTGISRVMAAIVADPLAVPDAVVPGTTTGEFTQGTSWTCGNVPTPVDDDETTPTYEYWTDQNSTYLPEPIP